MLSERRIGCWEPSSEPDYRIELGWFPARDPEGKYRLTLRSNEPSELLSELEHWMAAIERTPDRVQLLALPTSG